MKALILFFSILSTALAARADGFWAGQASLHNVHRGTVSDQSFQGAVANICGYNEYSAYFQVYDAGITDAPGVSVWQSLNADAQMILADGSFVHTIARPNYIGQSGNNAVYSLDVSTLGSRLPFHGWSSLQIPVTIEVSMNGKTVLQLPLAFTCFED